MKKLIPLFLCLALGGHNMSATGAPPTHMQAHDNRPTLYYSPYCPYSREVLAYLTSIQKKIPLKNVKQDPQAKEELKRIGGILEVPCLIIGDQALYSSGTIIE